jgi:crotonobetainyl-CoA:carnitine CoA-transferase CaiB-like acyl-CoA transferase
VLAVGNDRQFAMLCTVLGVAELADDSRFASNAARVENRVALKSALEERLATRTARTWAAELSEAGVPAGVVNDIGAAFELARELGLRPTVAIERDDGTAIELTRNPIGLSATPPSYRGAPPRFGEDI